jgi:hypothetical protein
MSLSLERIKKSQSTLSIFFATILVIPFQVLILGYALIQSLDVVTAQVSFGVDVYAYFAGYIALTVIYCIILSLSFNPKRIVSPINVQIGSSVVLSILLIAYEIRNSVANTLAEALNLLTALGIVISFLVFFLVALGFFQFFFVRWVVALNFESVDRLSYSINAKTEEVMSIMDDEFIDVWGFSRRKDNPKVKKNPIWILKCRDPYGNRVVLSVGSNSANDATSLLGTVAYQTTLYTVQSSKSALGMRTSIINDIKERLRKANAQFALTELATIDDTVSFKAYSHALASTCPKTEVTKEFFKKIPRYYLYGIIITVLAITFITGAFILGRLDVNTYIGAIIVPVIALIAELGVSLREELKSEEIEELD